MGWSGDTNIAIDMIKTLQVTVDNYLTRRMIYRTLIKSLGNEDWDTIDEAMGYDSFFDLAVVDVYPSYKEDIE